MCDFQFSVLSFLAIGNRSRPSLLLSDASIRFIVKHCTTLDSPAGIQRLTNIESTLIQRLDVESILIQCCSNVMRLLGSYKKLDQCIGIFIGIWDTNLRLTTLMPDGEAVVSFLTATPERNMLAFI